MNTSTSKPLTKFISQKLEEKDGKAKTRKSKDQSRHPNVKMPGIPENENRENEEEINRNLSKNFSEPKDTFPG